jgi:Secretion system C-terminal sorting domain
MKKTFIVMSMFVLPSLLFASDLEINGIAAATMNNACKITSLTSTSSAITVAWTERYSDGTMVMKYGTTNPPTTNHAVTASERSAKKVVISNMLESTTYYVEIVASKTGETSYGANGSVTTLSSTAVKNFNVAENPLVTVIQNDRSITVLSSKQLSENASVKLFNAAGANVNVQNRNLENNGYQMTFRTDGLSRGRYFLKVNANGISTDRVIIIK